MAYGDGYGGSTSTTRPKSTSGGTPAPRQSSGGSYGGGYGSSGGSSSGGGSSSTRSSKPTPTVSFKKPKKQTYDVEKNLIRLAARLSQLQKSKPHQAKGVESKLRENLSGYTLGDINRLAGSSGIPDEVTQTLRRYVKPAGQGEPVFQTLLDYVGRPSQAVQGGFSEAGPGQVFSPEGAIKGLTGQESYTPIQTVARSIGGQSKLKAQHTEAGLNPLVRFGGNLALGVAYDPTTYLSFGTTAGSKAAIDSAASTIAAERASQAGRAFANADDVASVVAALKSGGIKALPKEERGLLGKGVIRGLRGAKGGVKVAGRSVIPGKAFESDALAAVRNKILGSKPVQAVEDVARTLPEVRQAERAGTVPAGTVERVAQSMRRAESATTVSAEDWSRLAGAGVKITEPASRARLVAALEDPALVPDLTKQESKAFDVLDAVRREKTALATQTGRLRAQVPPALAAPNVDAQARQIITDIAARAKAGDKAAAAQLRLPSDQLYEQALGQARQAPTGVPDQFVGSFGDATPAMTTDRYFPRVLSEESAKTGGLPSSPISLTGTQPGFTRAREAATKFEPTPSIIDPHTGLPRFETDPFVATYKHAATVNADAAKTRFIQDMREIKGPSGSPLIQTADELHPDIAKVVNTRPLNSAIGDQVVKEVPVRAVDEATGEVSLQTQRVLVDKILAHDPAFDRVMKVFADPAKNKDLLNFYDKTMRLWKSYATTFGPFSGGFGLRNFLGNQINGFYLTGTNPIWQVSAFKMLRKFEKGIKEGEPWKYLKAGEEASVRDALSTGVLGHGFYTEDLTPGKLAGALRNPTEGVGKKVGRAINPLSVDNFLLKRGRNFNTGIEDSARLGLFLAKKKGGFTSESASSLVQKYLFDYGELSAADQAIKHVIPFWTWTRKNLPLQLETLLKTPGAITSQYHALEALKSVTPGFNQIALPQWAREENAAVLPGGDDAYVPDLPITSAQDNLKPLQDVAQVIKSIQHGTPADFKGLGRDTFLALQPGGPLAGLPGALTQMATGKNVFSGAQTKPGDKVGPLPADLEQFLEQILPVGPGIAKVRGVVNSRTRGPRALSGLTGVTTTPLNKRTMTNEEYRRLSELTDFATWLKKQGVIVPTIKYAKKG